MEISINKRVRKNRAQIAEDHYLLNGSMISGIYMIQNIKNNKCYIGSTAILNERWRDHKRKLNKGKHKNSKLQNAWKKYGPDYFEFRIIERCLIPQLLKREQFWMSFYSSYNNGYNCLPETASCLGLIRGPQTEEHRKKNSEAKKGRNNANFGKPRSEETKKKISEAQIGKPRKKQSIETKALKSRSLKLYYKNNPDKKKNLKNHLIRIRKMRSIHPHTEETKIKMSLSQRARFKNTPMSEDTKRKMSLSRSQKRQTKNI